MEIEILDMEIKPDKVRLAKIVILYYEMYVKCDLVFYPKGDKVWIRMPEAWFVPYEKTTFCGWPNREISDKFQKIVLKKIFDKYDLDFDKVKEIHLNACKERELNRQNLNK